MNKHDSFIGNKVNVQMLGYTTREYQHSTDILGFLCIHKKSWVCKKLVLNDCGVWTALMHCNWIPRGELIWGHAQRQSFKMIKVTKFYIMNTWEEMDTLKKKTTVQLSYIKKWMTFFQTINL